MRLTVPPPAQTETTSCLLYAQRKQHREQPLLNSLAALRSPPNSNGAICMYLRALKQSLQMHYGHFMGGAEHACVSVAC